MSETDYSIDEVKLMTKVDRYKRRWKEQRHYNEHLKCKLAKKAMQVRELKEEVKTLQAIKSGWNVLDDIESENTALRIRIAELEAERRWRDSEVELPAEDTDGNALLAIHRHSGEWVRAPFGIEFSDEFVRHYSHWMYAPEPPVSEVVE